MSSRECGYADRTVLAIERVEGGDRGGGVDTGKAVHTMQLVQVKQCRLEERVAEKVERRPSATRMNE